MTTQFKSKEHYIAFLNAWKTAVNSDKAKSTVKHDSYTVSSGNSTTTFHYAERVSGWMTGAHHVLYNILRNRTFHRGFTMVSNKNKLLHGTSPCLGLYQATQELRHIQKMIRQEAEHNAKPETKRKLLDWNSKKKDDGVFWGTSRIDAFLAPFNGTVDRDMIMDIDVPEVKMMYTSWGEGAKIVAAILKGEYSPKNYDDLLAVIEEVAK